ncbi:ATP-binding protein, partial [Acinetobacter baumannii]
LGHHLEDQGETVLLRLARGSGVDGLAAMAPRLDIGGVALLRPLLDQSRTRMRATLVARNQPWIEDESNQDTRYARTVM